MIPMDACLPFKPYVLLIDRMDFLLDTGDVSTSNLSFLQSRILSVAINIRQT